MTTIATELDMIRRRPDFVAASRAGIKVGAALVGLQLRDRGAPEGRPRIGFTVTKRVGNAVERNRMKRRLRAVVRAALVGVARPGFDYVLVARRGVLDSRFDRLARDVTEAVKRAHGRSASAARTGSAKAASVAGGSGPESEVAPRGNVPEDRREGGR